MHGPLNVKFAKIHVVAFSDTRQCSMVGENTCFRRNCCLHLHRSNILDSMALRIFVRLQLITQYYDKDDREVED
jgi:hypothetical protein